MTRSTDALAEIRRLYYGATKSTVARDIERAIDLLKSLPDEATRSQAAVYMDGLAQMRSEWGVKTAGSRATPSAGASKRR